MASPGGDPNLCTNPDCLHPHHFDQVCPVEGCGCAYLPDPRVGGGHIGPYPVPE